MTWAQLSPAEKTAAAKAAVATMSYREAAKALGTTVGAVAGSVYRPLRYGQVPLVVQPMLGTSELRHALLDGVAAEFGVPAAAITGDDRRAEIALARHAWWYLLALIPVPEFIDMGHGRYRARRETDGNVTAIAKLLRRNRKSIIHGIQRIEDLRDGSAFDARIERLEALLNDA